MSGEKKPKEIEATLEQIQESIAEANKIRTVLIETNGSNFTVKPEGVSNLELKEICREILFKLGG